MLSLPALTRIFIHREPVDFRKSHDGLSGIIRRDLKENPLGGDLFAFLNKRRDRVKLIPVSYTHLTLPTIYSV